MNKMQSIVQALDEEIRTRNVQAVHDAIEYLIVLQGRCSTYSALLTDAKIEHELGMDDSAIIDVCSRLASVRYFVEDYCMED